MNLPRLVGAVLVAIVQADWLSMSTGAAVLGRSWSSCIIPRSHCVASTA